MHRKGLSRRFFMSAVGTAMAGCATGRTPSLVRMGYRSPNEKLNVAAIGSGGKGRSDIVGCVSENIVALCDVDWNRAAASFDRFPNAERYVDFREMLDKEKSIDAVTVSTPDHTHTVAAMAAIQRKKHVYVQKPMTHDVYEARKLTAAAREYGVATQMGNQGHSGEGVRKLCEMIWSGAIGPIRTAHVWTNRPDDWLQGVPDPLPPEPIPESLNWDLWLGTAPWRPYNSGYHPSDWRGWWDFGCGALGDMGCHIMDPVNWALQLGPPKSVECIAQVGKNDQTAPLRSTTKYTFPARNGLAPVELYWYDGGNLPERPRGISQETKLGDGANGSLLIGDSGMITAGEYGGNPRLLPDEKMRDYSFPAPIIPRSTGHYNDWIQACKGGVPACSNFDYAGPFTETVLLGNIAPRCEGELLWDAEKMRFTNNDRANRFLRREYRDRLSSETKSQLRLPRWSDILK